MKCPFCDKEIHESTCHKCGETIPQGAKYCMECGASIADLSTEPDDDDFDFENRVLCPDGACTGIIENGRCTECGRQVKED
ncbi:conserved hypothetical protein [uncultured Desulfobacterium sp.]|uniref:Zinc-ribbon domain-containing protein n=1 Tax=uncultured Desulfobacterium sp. TaxID=201089 RepID=A0A445MRF1_9BACT|nr:conserved hypothetical protein [uncultured Desulfobacterium sp.]